VEQPKPPAPTSEPLTEDQTTEAYIEARREGKTTDLPVSPPTIAETIKPPAPPEPAAPTQEAIEVAQTDTYLEERKKEREHKRGGKQARIDKLTKEKAELEAKLASAPATPAPTPEPAKPAAEAVAAPAPTAAPTPTPAAVPPETKPIEVPKAKPRMNEYTDIEDYNAAMALWAASEAIKTEKAQPAAPVTPQYLQVRKEEFDRFLEKGKAFMAGHPDFNTTLEAAHVRGLTMSEAARTAITRLAVPEVAYWLAQPANDLAARKFMEMDDLQQTVEVGKIAEKLAVKPEDFVSNAPAPGTRLNNANTRSTVSIAELDTDDYIRARRQEKKNGRR
jgi:hypothetical protein